VVAVVRGGAGGCGCYANANVWGVRRDRRGFRPHRGTETDDGAGVLSGSIGGFGAAMRPYKARWRTIWGGSNVVRRKGF
jgi:hypothetical protein